MFVRIVRVLFMSILAIYEFDGGILLLKVIYLSDSNEI